MHDEKNINTKINLNNDKQIPILGLGVWQIPSGETTENAVTWALEAGYRHIDTAKFYANEQSVGVAIKNSKIQRQEIWVTTKLWPIDFTNPRKALDASLEKLGLDYIDLYLIHWPLPGMGQRIWKAMENFADEGLCKTIGVSNYPTSLLKNLLNYANIPPAINQVKCSPFNYPKDLHDFCTNNQIAFEAYSPLTRGKRLNDRLLLDLSEKYNKSPAPILLRWAIQKDIIVIPKSEHRERIIENANIFDFEIFPEDTQKLDALSSS